MAQALPDGIPRLEDTPHSRESIVDALRNSAATPSPEVALGTLYADAIEPDILAVLDRALREDLDTPDQRLLFRGIHILSGRLMTTAYLLFVAFLRGPDARVRVLLGDAIAALPKILAGLFDGDDEPLRALITDTNVNMFIRSGALRAMGTLCFDRKIGRESFAAFLRRLDEEDMIPKDDDFLWDTWVGVIGVLGLTELAARARAAFADQRIHPGLSSEKDFDRMLREASERPDDRERLAEEEMGTIDDVLVELEKYGDWDEAEADDADVDDDDAGEMTDDDLLAWAAKDFLPARPAHNPHRNVGRNDPCPCGSGKKFKKCCLRT